MSYWTVPPMWEGRTVAILASGPSMSPAVAAAVAHLPRIAINSTYRLAPDADVIYAADARWWNANPEAMSCPGILASIEHTPGKRSKETPEAVRVLRYTGRSGFDPHPGCLRTQTNSGAQALQIAVHARAARVLLCGFDMRGGHWHGQHAPALGNPDAEAFAKFRSAFRNLASALAPTGVSIINCTPGSALDCFPREPLADALRVSAMGAA